jgi:hypothetical protein
MLMAASIACMAAGCHFDGDGLTQTLVAADAAEPLPDAPTVPGPDAAPPPPPFCTPADTALVACYDFEDPDAPLLDGSSYGNDGSDVHDVLLVSGPPGRGQALAFSALSVAAVADDASLNLRTAATLELWVRATSLPPAGGRAGLVDNNGQYGLFLAPDGQVRCSMSSSVPIALKVVPGVWTHIACTYDGQTMRMYQDGVPASSTPTSITMNDGSADGMRVGANSPSGDVLDGAIDGLRIYSVARTDEQICRAAGRKTCQPMPPPPGP